ncbi:glycerol-3-phosphate 1-O-acyltransferase PlsY [Zymomonas sp.]|uniref:glycerol-3-phosphate 1-O-acyltransferase PlsY n=1 Tax=Zymomonas sp. TaxID=2068624 RepID=UPI0025FE8379|nr:glycerol-3-phosphate 1-O-acyltransferase PlsY [Zymomonas sp.]MCA1955328.1 glycerol-3-phosphate 1-O-acyltransferase PlsY [Zymomonas sp.]
MSLEMIAVLIFTMGYLLGSVPFGLILARLFGSVDVRQVGSGNIGATNVLRTGRKDLAALTLFFDIGKGALAVLLAHGFSYHLYQKTGCAPDLTLIAGAAAFIGHCYPVWLGFRGGKGVATMLGVSFAAWWVAGVVFAVAWLLSAKISRYSSVGGMVGAIAATISVMFMPASHEIHQVYMALFSGMTILLLWRHRGNIKRLLSGQESRIGDPQ